MISLTETELRHLLKGFAFTLSSMMQAPLEERKVEKALDGLLAHARNHPQDLQYARKRDPRIHKMADQTSQRTPEKKESLP